LEVNEEEEEEGWGLTGGGVQELLNVFDTDINGSLTVLNGSLTVLNGP